VIAPGTTPAAARAFRRDVLAVVVFTVGWVLFVLLFGSCGGAEDPRPCVEQLAPGDTGELSWPCPGAPGYSYGCAGSPSQKPLVDCEIDDGEVHHFRTACVDTCPGSR
jgi:hypothetical protein